jgi:transposase
MAEGFCGRSAAFLPRPWEPKPEAAEIARLRREVTKFKAERDILKKAAAYFAKENT